MMTAKKAFKVGDRVKSFGSVGPDDHGGYEGVVLTIKDGTVEVAFDGWKDGHSGWANKAGVDNCFFFFADSTSKLDGLSVLKLLPLKKPKAPHVSQEYKGNGKHTWELVAETDALCGPYKTYRLRVPGGWLYSPSSQATVFVPMPNVVKHAV